MLILVSGCGSGKAWRKVVEAHPPGPEGPPVVLVISIPAQDKNLEELTAWTTDQTVTLLSEAGCFRVADRSQTQSVLKEQKLAASGALAGEDAVELGRLLSAPTALTVTGLVCRIGNLEDKSSPRKTPTPSAKDGKREGTTAEILAGALLQGLGEGLGRGLAENLRTASLSVSVKRVNLETGQVVESLTLRAQGEGSGAPGAFSDALGVLERKLRRKLPELLLN